ncbi:spore coat U domain-containing protein [Yersinia sp. 2542 StPb PI]|uniref:Csu type fimbrial protein n=1 Tax=Yersinia sp. 2542 StPb PI TaxID=3117408 RepID=UPI003B28916C
MKKILLILGAVMVLQTAPVQGAGTASGTLNATLNIIAGCYIDNGLGSGNLSNLGTVNFGTVSDLTAPLSMTFSGTTNDSLKLHCSNNTAYSIAIDNGLHDNSGQRRLAGGTSEFVNYNLYRDNGFLQPWNATPVSGTVDGTGTGLATAIPLTIYARVPVQATPSVGTYLDTVTVTVTW